MTDGRGGGTQTGASQWHRQKGSRGPSPPVSKTRHQQTSKPHSMRQFGLLILRKTIITRSHISMLQCIKFFFGWGSALDPVGELISLPRRHGGGKTEKGGKGEKARGGDEIGSGEKGKGGKAIISLYFWLNDDGTRDHTGATDRSAWDGRLQVCRVGRLTSPLLCVYRSYV